MTQTGTTNAIVNAMLSWLKGLASWVLRLFNLSGGFSPLRFLANNWLHILVILLAAGVVVDLLIWLIRWRPHWVWFRKKRVIIYDKNFFADENDFDDEDDWELLDDPDDRDAWRSRNWKDNEFVVAGAARREREARREAMRRKARAERAKAEPVAEQPSEETTDVFRDGLFNLNAKQKFSDRYEDEVFSVNNLPQSEGEDAAQPKPRAQKSRAAAARSGRRNAPRREEARQSAARRRPRTSTNKR